MPTPLDQMRLLNSATGTGKATPDSARQRDMQLKKACRDFESVLVNYMMKQMRQTVSKSSLVGTSQAEQMYTSMLDGEVAKNISQARGIGLASILYQQMSGLVEAGETKK